MAVGSPVELRSGTEGFEIVVACDLDFENADLLAEAAERCRQGSVVIDLRRVRFIDSTGVHVFVQTLRNLAERGVALRRIRVTPAVFEILELVGCVDVVGRHHFEVGD